MTTIDTLTEHEKDRIAYTACGYTQIEKVNDFFFGTHPSFQPSPIADQVPLLPWTSTDAAIEHAELGGFRIREARQLPTRERPDDTNRWDVHIAVDDPRGGVSTKSFGSGRSQATAIRNAIVAWHLARKVVG